MTFKGKAYGFSEEQRKKQQSKYDMKVEKQVVNFINSVGISSISGGGPEKLHSQLGNGVLLCKIVNKIQGNIIKEKDIKLMVGRSNFDRQRVSLFINGAKKLGCKVHELFEPPDLVDKNNLTAVLFGLYAYGRKCKNTGKQYGIKPIPNTGTRME